jgi:uncharacterized membrane protein YhdT
MTDVFDENLIKSVLLQDERSVGIFNLTALPIFMVLLFLHANYLHRYEEQRKDFFTVTTVTACIMSLFLRIVLCMIMLFWFKDMSLSRNNFSS